jgi:beta-N-acetylhexosaminidase
VPATVSRAILTDLLKNELGFEGIVVTDAMEMQGVASLYSPGEAAVRALEAGADVLLMPTDPGACIRAITAAIASGRLTNKRIEASFQKVMAAKQRTGLFRSHLVDLDQLSDHLNDEKLERLAQDVANRAVTLLRDDKHLFPLAETEGSCLVVLAEGAFPTRGETLARELGRRIPTLKTFVINPGMPEELLSAIARQAFECKRIYAAAFATVAAGRGSVELEGGLPGFLKTLSQGTVPFALISFGNPYLWRGFPDITSYAATFSTAPTSEIAAAKAIMGEIAITGRMPVSIPGLAKIGDGLDVAAKARPASNGTE